MMDKETLLHKYFEGSLSADELLLFEQLLEEDVDFKAQFDFEKDVQVIVQDSQRTELKKKLQVFEFERSNSKSPKKTQWRPLRIAASIAILLGASWFVFNSGLFENSDNLYASNYEKYPNTAYTITRGDTTDNSLERQAFEAYEINDYQMAIHYLKELKEKTGLDYVDFYLAQSYLANGNAREAIDLFTNSSYINSDYKAESLWYAALGHLKLKQNRQASALLEKLVSDGTYKLEQATALLEELK